MHIRFFVPQKIYDNSEVILRDKDIYHKISKVIRMKVGDTAVILDNSGYEHICKIKNMAGESVILEVIEKKLSVNEPTCELALYQSILKKDKMEWVLEKGTEVGASRFVPLITRYSVKLDTNRDRAEKIIRQAYSSR